MAVQIRCPACRAGVVVQNANYLVVLNCHACGREFLADAEELSAGWVLPETGEPEEPWTGEAELPDNDPWQAGEDDAAVLMFCPMCGELAAESAPRCAACGEPLPVDGSRNDNAWDPTTGYARRFRRHARCLGVLWILMAYALSGQDFWVGGTELALPPMFLSGKMPLPPIPLMTTILIGLGAFALVGQFWAVAVGGLLNYLILFLVVWRVNFFCLGLITVSIVLTHYVLHQASAARFR